MKTLPLALALVAIGCTAKTTTTTPDLCPAGQGGLLSLTLTTAGAAASESFELPCGELVVSNQPPSTSILFASASSAGGVTVNLFLAGDAPAKGTLQVAGSNGNGATISLGGDTQLAGTCGASDGSLVITAVEGTSAIAGTFSFPSLCAVPSSSNGVIASGVSGTFHFP